MGATLNAIRHHVPSANVVNLDTFMAVEQARVCLVPKPWGRTDLRPWNVHHDAAARMGEVWFERSGAQAPCPALLLELIFPFPGRLSRLMQVRQEGQPKAIRGDRLASSIASQPPLPAARTMARGNYLTGQAISSCLRDHA